MNQMDRALQGTIHLSMEFLPRQNVKRGDIWERRDKKVAKKRAIVVQDYREPTGVTLCHACVGLYPCSTSLLEGKRRVPRTASSLSSN